MAKKKRGPGGRNQWRARGGAQVGSVLGRGRPTTTAEYEDHRSAAYWDYMDANYLVRCIVCERLCVRLGAHCELGHEGEEHGGVCDYCVMDAA